MDDRTALVRDHYEDCNDSEDIVSRISRAIDGMGSPVDLDQLAGFDQFHVRGLPATAELGLLLDIQRGSIVLDAGSGLGGPSRYLAKTYDCKVTGVDLTPSYVAVAKLLAERTGLSGVVDYDIGNLLALPFPNARFDAAYTQHVVMNIRDRARAYRELRRVLKQGARFAFHDILATDGKPEPHYPVPWAKSREMSFLMTEAETRTALAHAALSPDAWTDVTADAIAWFAQMPPPSPQGRNLALVMGPRFREMAANLARNLAEGLVRLMMGTCTATPRAPD